MASEEPPALSAGARVSRPAERRDAEQQRLLKDENEGCGHDIVRIAAGGVEQWLREEIDRRGAAGHRRIDEAALAAGAARRDVVGDC